MEEFPSLTPTSTPSANKSSGDRSNKKGKSQKEAQKQQQQEKSYVDIASTIAPPPAPVITSPQPTSAGAIVKQSSSSNSSSGKDAHVPSVQMQLTDWVVSGKLVSTSYQKYRDEAKMYAQARAVYFDNATQAYLG